MNSRETILEIAVAAPVAGAFDYLPPAGAGVLEAGRRLLVPFGRGRRIGLLLGTKNSSSVAPGRLRRALQVLDDAPLLPPDLLRLIRWAANYYQHPVGDVFVTAVPKALREGGQSARGEERWTLTREGLAQDPAGLRSGMRKAILAALHAAAARGEEGLTAAALRKFGPAWRRGVRELLARGWLAAGSDPLAVPVGERDRDDPPALNDAQRDAVTRICATTGFHAFLLDGVTGSGKTEVYLRAIAHALAEGRQSLVIVPEIGLTPQLVRRFSRRFPVPIVQIHSGLTDAERLRSWTAAASGAADIVIGTRSAVFTPLPRAGLIVVDEEHDASLKQQEGFRYSARDLAVWRARELGVPLVLGSATPSLESAENARAGRYTRLVLAARAGSAGPPAVQVVDLRASPARDGLSQPLLGAIRRHLDQGGQALLYLNRRGFAPVLLCPGCGWVAACSRCDARMVYHQRQTRLACHHCGAEQGVPGGCPECHGELRPVGQGTERLEQALAKAFPDEGLVRVDRDTTRRRGEIGRRLDRVRTGNARLLLGTQMLAKGHDFPGVTLVGIVDADQGLFGTDFRSAERLAQTFTQVAGRAGRADRPGEVYIQTLFPDHPLLRILVTEGYGRFTELALAERRQAGWPPYSFLALLRAEAAERAAVYGFLDEAAALARRLLAQRLPAEGTASGASGRFEEGNTEALRLLGPAPAPMERRSGRFRGQLLLQAGSRRDLHEVLPAWRAGLAALPSRRRARWSLDVDPVELI